MNDNLKNYNVEPDSKVWQDIKNVERRAWVRRVVTTGVAGGLIVTSLILSVIFWPAASKSEAMSVEPEPVSGMVSAVDESTSENQELLADGTASVVATHVNEPSKNISEQSCSVSEEPKIVTVERRNTPMPEVARISAVVTEPQQMKVVAEVADRGVDEAMRTMLEQAKQTQPQSTAKAGSSTNVPDTILWVPNAFAPASGDPELQVFHVRLNRNDASISNFKMAIYNRAGHQVFSSMDINTTWDGTYRGNRLPQGAYVYVLYYTDADGFQHQRKGTVTLIR